MKSAVRKSDGPLFCHLIRSLAHDPKLAEAFEIEEEASEADYDLSTAPARLKQLLESGPSKKTGSKAKKSPKAGAKKSKSAQSKNGSSREIEKENQKIGHRLHPLNTTKTKLGRI